MDATFPPSPLCFFDFNQTRCKPKFGTPKMFIDGPLKKFRTTNFDTQGNARRVSNHDFDFENWTPVFCLAKRLVYCISLWVEKKLSERVLRGLMHATAELKRRIKGWILEQGGRKLHSKFRRQR